MDAEWMVWIWAGLIAFFATVIQSMIGFGYSLIALPLLLGIGLELPDAVAFSVTTSIAQRILFSWSMRKYIPWKALKAPILSALVFLFVGIYTLGIIAGQNRELVRQCVGGLLVVLVLVQTFARVKPRDQLHPVWGALAGSAGGFLAGLMNIGGPPMVLWAYAHNWTQQTLRVVLVGSSLPLIPVHLALLFLRFGAPIGIPLLIGALFAPVILLGTKIGLVLGNRFHVQVLRAVVMITLVLMGVFYILEPFLR